MTFLRTLLALSASLFTVISQAPSALAASDDVQWRDEWPRFRAWQYAMTQLLAGAGVGTRYLAPDPGASPGISGGILFDTTVSDGVGIENESARWATAIATDGIFYSLVAYRALDSTLVPGAIHDAWPVAQQMTLLDAQAYAVIAAALWVPQAFIGRDRPINQRCDDPEVREHELVCNPDDEQRYRSFVSGHVAVAVALASLTCLHHANIPLYGGGIYDDVACGTTIGLSSLVAVGRTISLNHWASDALLGALLGLGAGYVLPAALHYGFDGEGTGSASSALGTKPNASLRTSPAALPLLSLGGRF